MTGKELQKKFSKLHPAIRNHYLITLFLFFAWMIFMDENNLLNQYRKYSQLKELREKRAYYIEQIKTTNQQYAELTTNPESQEKFAREKYRMKRDNEDVFVIVKE
jgi:cell division protein DivIC